MTYRELAPRPNSGERWDYGSINGCNARTAAVQVLVGDEIEIGIGASNTNPRGGTDGMRYFKVTRTAQGLVAEFLRQTTSPTPPPPPVGPPPPPATRADCSPLKYPVLLISGIDDPDGGFLRPLRDHIRDQLNNQNNRKRCVILVSDHEDMELEWNGIRGAAINPNLEFGWMAPTNFNNFPKNIDLLKAGSGADKVAIVAYSQGGLQSRHYLEAGNYFPDRKDVALLITLGTPHLGSNLGVAMCFNPNSAKCYLNPSKVEYWSRGVQQPDGVMYYMVGGDNPGDINFNILDNEISIYGITSLVGYASDGVVTMYSSWFIRGRSIKEHQVERAVSDHCHSRARAAEVVCNPDTTYGDLGARDGLWNRFILPILKGEQPQQYVFGKATFESDIRPKHSGKCLDIAGWKKDNGAFLTQWDCHNGDNQKFRAVEAGDELQASWRDRLSNRFWLVAKHSGKCLDVSGGSKANGAPIVQWTCHGGNNQVWEQDGWSNDQLKSVHSKKCLDVAGASRSNGAWAIQYDCNFNTKNQNFDFNLGIPNLQQAIWGADADAAPMPAQEPEAPALELYPIERQITLDTIAPGSTTTLSTTLDNSISNLQFMLYSTAGVSFTLRDADGRRYTPDNAGDQFWQLPDWGLMGAYGITERMTGTWQIEVTASAALTESVTYVVVAKFASPYSVQIVDRPTVVQPNTDIPLLARITGLTSTNQLELLVHRNGQPFTTGTLYDDGQHNDLVANDGYFGGSLNGLSEAGEYEVIVEFTEGDIHRSTRTTLTVAPDWATLQGRPIQQIGLTAAGQRVYDVDVNVAEHGHYVVLATLANQHDEAVSFARTAALLDPGMHTIPLTFTGDILDTIPDDELVLREVRLLEGMSLETYQLTDVQEQRIVVNSSIITGTTASLTVQASGLYSYAVLDFGDQSKPVTITERLFSTSHTYPKVGNYTATVTLYTQNGSVLERSSFPIRIEQTTRNIYLPFIVRR
ncbi:MAG: hypothetical protein CV045_12210 [Cyanobacteria bacterium M5B4]|nr:MAG: hypothetical protein CV045_12210 [Cyanobacteria bacterium M5B4]